MREAFLQHQPVPWTPWSQALVEELAPRAIDPRNPSVKPRQTVFDYALWHGQQAWVERLGAVNFAPARGLLDEGEFFGAGSLKPRAFELPQWQRLEGLTQRTVAAVRQRHLQPYAAKNTRTCCAWRTCTASTTPASSAPPR